MGFRSETRNFVQTFILDQTDRRMFELGLAADALKEAVSCARLSIRAVATKRAAMGILLRSHDEPDFSFAYQEHS